MMFFLTGVAEVSGDFECYSGAHPHGFAKNHRGFDRRPNLGRAAGNGHRTLEHLFQHPIVSVNEVRDLVGVTYPAASSLVDRLTDIGILNEITLAGQRNRRFIEL